MVVEGRKVHYSRKLVSPRLHTAQIHAMSLIVDLSDCKYQLLELRVRFATRISNRTIRDVTNRYNFIVVCCIILNNYWLMLC